MGRAIEFFGAGAWSLPDDIHRCGHGRLTPVNFDRADPLFGHCDNAVLDIAVNLSDSDYTNQNGRPFKCRAFYADRPERFAFIVKIGDTHYATVSIGLVRQLLLVAHRLGVAFAARSSTEADGKLGKDAKLTRLVRQTQFKRSGKDRAIASAFPSTDFFQGVPIAEFAIFYDLLRLVWLHEWSHGLFGHAGFVQSNLGLSCLNESSRGNRRRPPQLDIGFIGYARDDYDDADSYEAVTPALAMQSMELDADWFAAGYSANDILYGFDPVGKIVGEKVDLVDRFLAFNSACAAFAVMWSATEPPYSASASTHPAASMRYVNFLDTERKLTTKYDEKLPVALGGATQRLLKNMMRQSAEFERVHFNTPSSFAPWFFRNPNLEGLDKHIDRLERVRKALLPTLRPFAYRAAADRKKGEALEEQD